MLILGIRAYELGSTSLFSKAADDCLMMSTAVVCNNDSGDRESSLVSWKSKEMKLLRLSSSLQSVLMGPWFHC